LFINELLIAPTAGGLQAACGRRLYWTQRRQAAWQAPWNWTHLRLILNMALITWHGTVSFEKQSRISDTVGLLYRYVCCGITTQF